MRGRSVLITNLTLGGRTGTELYVRDLALGLRARGERPWVYAGETGPLAEELRSAGVPVVQDLEAELPVPDVVHAHHHPKALAVLARFPEAPALFVVHDALAWHDTPPRHPRIHRYVAVDEPCLQRILAERAPASEQIRLIPNGVDLRRFRPRAPLPARPRRALVFSHAAREQTQLPALRTACARAGIELDVIGEGVGRSEPEPEKWLGGYDLVFAKARCALEALAVGTGVVLCDHQGVGPWVDPARLAELRRLNFGRLTLRAPLDPDVLRREIDRYDPQQAAEVSRRVRRDMGLEQTLDALEALYDEVIRARVGEAGPDREEEGRALAAGIAWLGGFAREQQRRAAHHEAEAAALRQLRSVRAAAWLRRKLRLGRRPR